MPQATWSPLPMPYGPMGGDPGREGTGLGTAFTAVALTAGQHVECAPYAERAPRLDPTLVDRYSTAAAAFSRTIGGRDPGGGVKLRLRFLLEFLRITYDLFDSPHPPTALIMLLGLDDDDVRLRGADPTAAFRGPRM